MCVCVRACQSTCLTHRDIRECLKLDQDHSQCHAHYKVGHLLHTDSHTHMHMWMSAELRRTGITISNHTFPSLVCV